VSFRGEFLQIRLFDKKGYIVVENSEVDEEALMEIAIDAGAEDVREDENNFEIIIELQDFESVKTAIDKESIPYIVAEITMPKDNIEKQIFYRRN